MALSTIQLTVSGDIEMNTLNQSVTLTAQTAIEQKVKAAVSLWLGNWYLDLQRGVDWLNVMKKQYSTRQTVQVLQKAVLQLGAVTKVIDVFLRVDKIQRTAKITYIVIADREKVTGSISI